MIYSNRNGKLRAIRQTDHAAACGPMAEAWGRPPFRPLKRLESVRKAAAGHDEGWRDWEQAPAVGAGGVPIGFLDLPVPAHLELHRRGIRKILAEDAYAGLLVSMHASGLYNGRFGLEPGRRYAAALQQHRLAMEVFLHGQERLRQRLVRIHQWPAGERAEAYRLLQFWDRLSLLFCMHASKGPVLLAGVPGGQDSFTVAASVHEGEVRLAPYPFITPELRIVLRFRVLDRSRFDDGEALSRALAAAPEQIEEITIRPADSPGSRKRF